MRTLRAFPLPLDLNGFKLPISPDSHLLGVFETVGLVAFALVDPKEKGETTFYAFRDGDEVPNNLEFVTSGQRANGGVVMLFRDKAKVPA